MFLHSCTALPCVVLCSLRNRRAREKASGGGWRNNPITSSSKNADRSDNLYRRTSGSPGDLFLPPPPLSYLFVICVSETGVSVHSEERLARLVCRAQKKQYGSFDEMVQEADKPILVDFNAAWCGE